MYTLYNIKGVSDERGELFFVQNDAEIPFKIERCFWIKNVPAGEKRGCHAHRTCGELIIAAAGKFCVDVTNGKQTETITLDSTDKALYIPPYTWCELHDFTPDSLCLCMASQPYIAEGYIDNYEAYREEMLNRNKKN